MSIVSRTGKATRAVLRGTAAFALVISFPAFQVFAEPAVAVEVAPSPDPEASSAPAQEEPTALPEAPLVPAPLPSPPAISTNPTPSAPLVAPSVQRPISAPLRTEVPAPGAPTPSTARALRTESYATDPAAQPVASASVSAAAPTRTPSTSGVAQMDTGGPGEDNTVEPSGQVSASAPTGSPWTVQLITAVMLVSVGVAYFRFLGAKGTRAPARLVK